MVGRIEPVCDVQIVSHSQSQSSVELMVFPSIKSFFSKYTRQLSDFWMDFEIWGGIFPHLNQKHDNGYPFRTDEELEEQIRRDIVYLRTLLDEVEQAGAEMPTAYGLAFRFIAYRDLKQRMVFYRQFARKEKSLNLRNIDPRLVARAVREI